MSSLNKDNHGKPYSPPVQTPVPLPRFPGFTHHSTDLSSTTTPSHDARASLPRFPGSTQGPSPSMTAASNQATSAGQSIRGVSGSSTPGSRMHASAFEIMLPAPATPHQYETVDEPEDELQAADEPALPGLRPQPSKKFTTVARERPSHPPVANIITPVPLPKTAALPGGTPQPRSGTSTPGSKSGNKGRPKGWKPGMSYAAVRNFGPEIAAKFAASNPIGNRQAGTAKLARASSARKPKPKPAPAAPVTTTKKRPTTLLDLYMDSGVKSEPFRCEWEGCQSRLHNLKTLEKHVDIVHCRGERKECLWKRCAYAGISFDTDEELGTHLREVHFIPYAWHLGDGPKISFGVPVPDLEELPGYLFDKTGRQVTDSTRGQKVEDAETQKKRKKALSDSQKPKRPAPPYEVDSEDEDEAMVLGWSSAFP